MRVTLTASELRLEVEQGEMPVPVEVRGESHAVYPDGPVVVPLDGHGTRRSGTLGNSPQTGGTRADGSRITAGVPDPMPVDDADLPEPPVVDAPVPEPSITAPD
jgi:alpha,alpha-trehalose phosphorylase